MQFSGQFDAGESAVECHESRPVNVAMLHSLTQVSLFLNSGAGGQQIEELLICRLEEGLSRLPRTSEERKSQIPGHVALWINRNDHTIAYNVTTATLLYLQNAFHLAQNDELCGHIGACNDLLALKPAGERASTLGRRFRKLRQLKWAFELTIHHVARRPSTSIWDLTWRYKDSKAYLPT